MNTTQIVNDLLQTLEDGREGFAKAAENVKDSDLKTLFQSYSAERAEMIGELRRVSPPAADEAKSTVAGAVHRGWINLKSALTSGDDHAILAECERGEDHAVAKYREALDEALPEPVRSVVASQSARVLGVHNKVRELRDFAQAVK